MTLRRPLSWLGIATSIAGIAVLVGVGVSYAQTDSRAPSTSAMTRALARVNYENAHFIRVRHPYNAPLVGEPATRIKIPVLGIDSPIVPTAIIGGTWQVADWAVGYLQGSANPGACTTFNGLTDCSTDLAAHDDIKGELFKNLNTLHNGQHIYVYTRHTVFNYVVNGQQAVTPQDGSVLDSAFKSLTLITCEPYWVDTTRLVVTAALVNARSRHHL